jgi:hypothetical protein
MKKKIVIPVFIFACMFFLAGCTKTSLTGGNTGTASNTPSAGVETPPSDGGTPPADGGTPPSDGGAPTGGQSGN